MMDIVFAVYLSNLFTQVIEVVTLFNILELYDN